MHDWELLFLLGMSFQLQLRDFVAALDHAGFHELRPIHGLIFQAVNSGINTGSQIAAHIGVTKQAATLLLDELEEWGYVSREPHPAGGRRKLIVMTPRGIDHFTVAGRTLQDLERALAAKLSVPVTQQLRASLIDLIAGTAGGELPPFRPSW